MQMTSPEQRRGRPAAAADPLYVSSPRFLVELIAWVATPWALVPHSIVLAIVADAILIGLPTIFGMPGAKKQRNPIAVSGIPAIAIELLQSVAACVAAFAAWPEPLAWCVLALVGVAAFLQRKRWRWMLTAS